MRIIYENERGKVLFHGGGSDGFRLIEVTGLGMPTNNFNTTGYAGEDGSEVLSSFYSSRTITLSADVFRDKVPLLEKATFIFGLPGTLSIQNGLKVRTISARVSSVDFGERAPAYQMFVVQFFCDRPFFHGEKQIRHEIFKREDLIVDEFTLPCVWTERTNVKTVVNDGHVKAEPVVTIINYGNAAEEGEDYGITLYNRTEGQEINLLYNLGHDETVIIDFAKRKITSSTGANLVQYLAVDSFLSQFYLSVGANEIEVAYQNAAAQMEAVLTFEKNYLEAVY